MHLIAFDVDVNVTLGYKASMPHNALTYDRDVDTPAQATPAQATEWGIQDFAKIFGVTPRTIRFYEDKGLIAPKRHNGTRVFGARDYIRIQRVLRAKRLGFSLDDIKTTFEVIDGEVTTRDELLLRKAAFERVIKSLGRRREDIEIIAQEMSRLCTEISDFIESAPLGESGVSTVFQNAAAYDAKFRQTLGEGFSQDGDVNNTPNNKRGDYHADI